MKRRQIRLQGDKWQAILVWDDLDEAEMTCLSPHTSAEALAKAKVPERFVLFGSLEEDAALSRIEAHELPWLIHMLSQLLPGLRQQAGFISGFGPHI